MVSDLIKNRQSVREFKNELPSDEQIEAVLDAANLAPSWVNSQPWHFIVVKDKATKSVLAKLSHGQSHVDKAPVVIVCCGDLDAWDYKRFKKVLEARPGITPDRINQILSNPSLNPRLHDDSIVFLRTVEQVTYATAYMTIEAQNQGLGACVIGAVGNEITKTLPAPYQVAREVLGLPENMFILSYLILGIPKDDTTTEKSRKNKSEIISFERYSSR